MGYPSALNAIARYALEHHDFPAPAQALFTTSETVTDEVREALERTWQCQVFDHYGAVEACVFASQCEHGRYHVSPEIGVVEILDGRGQPAPPGVMGEVVCTGLQNLLQPLIRYRIGDVARWSTDQSCECGREMAILEAVEGRCEDICRTPDGRQLLRFDTVFKGIENIREAQVVQVDVDRFVIRVVPTPAFSAFEATALVSNMRLHVGPCRIEVEQVASIERTRSGKFRAVVCQVPVQEKRPFASAH
jgi:phenylacetate-CoA ligase